MSSSLLWVDSFNQSLVNLISHFNWLISWIILLTLKSIWSPSISCIQKKIVRAYAILSIPYFFFCVRSASARVFAHGLNHTIMISAWWWREMHLKMLSFYWEPWKLDMTLWCNCNGVQMGTGWSLQSHCQKPIKLYWKSMKWIKQQLLWRKEEIAIYNAQNRTPDCMLRS